MFVHYSVNTNIEISGFLHQLITNGRNAPVTEAEGRIKGQELVTGYSPAPRGDQISIAL